VRCLMDWQPGFGRALRSEAAGTGGIFGQ